MKITWSSTVRALRRDAARYGGPGLGGWWCNAGFYIGLIYRLAVWAHALPWPVGLPLRILLLPARWWHEWICNVHIPTSTRIGPGLCLIHARNIYIGWDMDIGEDCLIFHEVTFGTGPLPIGLPTVGNRVDIYVGAKVLGGITVGDDAKIGANCVVNHNVKPGSVVVVAANRVIPASLVQACGPSREAREIPSEPKDVAKDVPKDVPEPRTQLG